MHRLIDNELIFGTLMSVSEPHLVARYNQALAGFGLSATKRDEFTIDMTGFSPQIAEELGDPQYLDPAGINRRFIILTPDQAELPVVHTQFSNTEDLMAAFFEHNRRALHALTIKDVVYGEIEDSIFQAHDIEDLLAIEQVEFKVSTVTDLLGRTGELKTLIERLTKEPDAWREDALLERMVECAKVTGDIRTNELVPDQVLFRHNTFWTGHFGGVYVFIDETATTVIADPAAPGFRRSRPWQVAYIDIGDKGAVYRFLAQTGRIDPPRGSWIERTGLLELRAKRAATWLAMRDRPPEEKIDERWLKSWIGANSRAIEDDGTIPLINWVNRQVTNWSSIDMNEIHPDHRFALCRANPEHADHYLVNRLISEYLPFDHMTRYIYHKQGFYRDYENWPEVYRDHVVGDIARHYMSDRRGYRQQLYH